jgi:multidrug efflux pump subunit AcrB
MWLLDFALRRPISVIVAVISIALCAALALSRMNVDIFPNLNLPVIYVVQPYGGMDPTQMEGYMTDWYEDHFFYIDGIKAVESKCIEQVSIMKLTFHSGTNMAEAMANTVAQIERARAFMPPGTVGPFVLRFDAGSVPAGYLVVSSPKRSLGELQDLAITRVRPIFSSLEGVSGAPAFGGNQRTIVLTADPERMRAFHLTGEELVKALAQGNTIVPNGDVRVGSLDRMSPVNAVVKNIHDLEMLPVRSGAGPAVFIRDVAKISDSTDIPTGYALVNGHRTIYVPVVKLGSASTLSVVNEVKDALPMMRHAVPEDVSIEFKFDQSIFVTSAIMNLFNEGWHGALLTGLMVLLFLRDVRSALIVLVSIPAAVLTAIMCLWFAGQTVNIMTLGGLALAIGILVDEATVTIENIHTHLSRGEPLNVAVLGAGRDTVTPRLLAMLSVISVFVPSFFMQGATKGLFVPLSLAVGFSMLASYILSSTLVPVVAIFLLKPKPERHKLAAEDDSAGLFGKIRDRYMGVLTWLMAHRALSLATYGAVAVVAVCCIYPTLGRQIFPTVDSGQFQLRLRAPAGTRFEVTELITKKVLALIEKEAGKNNVDISIGYAGTQPPAYALSNIYIFTSGPHEAVLTVAFKSDAHIPMEPFKEKLRKLIPEVVPGTNISFEAGDIISKIMNFGSPTPIQVAISGMILSTDKTYAHKVLHEMKKIPVLRDVEFEQPLSYPTIAIDIDRERAGQLGVTLDQVGRSLAEATSSSRWIAQNYWCDPKTGVSYQVQVEMPQWHVGSLPELENVPVMRDDHSAGPYVRDVAKLRYSTMPGEIDHYNQQRLITISANLSNDDLGRAATAVNDAIKRAGPVPRGVFVDVRGQTPTMNSTFFGLQTGMLLAIVVITLMLTSNFQSLPLALVILCVAPAIVAGEVLALFITGTTLNVQSFMGGIMAIGVGVSNAILLITFAEDNRIAGESAQQAAMSAGRERLRPVMMTSIAMIAGMIPMALSGDAQASLAVAVIGGLLVSTPTVLLILPLAFSSVRAKAGRKSASVHPEELELEIRVPVIPGSEEGVQVQGT